MLNIAFSNSLVHKFINFAFLLQRKDALRTRLKFSYHLEQQVLFLHLELGNKDNYLKSLRKQLSRQTNITCSFQDRILKLEKFSTVKETMNDKPSVYLILMIGDNLDPPNNKEVPLYDGWITKPQ